MSDTGEMSTTVKDWNSVKKILLWPIYLLGLLQEHLQNRPIREKKMPKNLGKSPNQLSKEAHDKIGIDTKNNYNIAVCGLAGVGKSALNNALRGVDDPNSPLYAKTMAGTEGTKELKEYKHPHLDHVYIWDIPGAGTLDHPSENYFIEKCLYAFDYMIIVGNNRFNEVEFKMMKEAQIYNVPVAMVRSKLDNDIDNKITELMKSKKQFDVTTLKNELKRTITEEFETCLRNPKLAIKEKPPVFLVSYRAFFSDADQEKYGFDEEMLVRNVINETKKRRTLKIKKSKCSDNTGGLAINEKPSTTSFFSNDNKKNAVLAKKYFFEALSMKQKRYVIEK